MQQLCDHIHLKMSTVWLNEKKKKKMWHILILSPSICQETRAGNEGIPDDLKLLQ